MVVGWSLPLMLSVMNDHNEAKVQSEALAMWYPRAGNDVKGIISNANLFDSLLENLK